jgi:hypothetical protein
MIEIRSPVAILRIETRDPCPREGAETMKTRFAILTFAVLAVAGVWQGRGRAIPLCPEPSPHYVLDYTFVDAKELPSETDLERLFAEQGFEVVQIVPLPDAEFRTYLVRKCGLL